MPVLVFKKTSRSNQGRFDRDERKSASSPARRRPVYFQPFPRGRGETEFHRKFFCLVWFSRKHPGRIKADSTGMKENRQAAQRGEGRFIRRPLPRGRGETEFRRKFFCLLFFSRKVGQRRTAPSSFSRVARMLFTSSSASSPVRERSSARRTRLKATDFLPSATPLPR